MTLRTAFTDLLGIAHPVALAPMGGRAGGVLAAAVSSGGGLGLVGGGGDADWLDRELAIAAAGTASPWGVGFLSWAADVGAVDLGADVIVAQGTEAGGHGCPARRSTLPFVPAVVDLVAPGPGAGGWRDRRRTRAGHRSRARVRPERSSAPASRPLPKPMPIPRSRRRSPRAAGGH